MRLMRREYMKMLLVEEEPVEDGISDLRDTTVAGKRLKEVTINHLVENFQKLGKPSVRESHYLNRSTREESDIFSMRSSSNRQRYGSIDDSNYVVGVDKIESLINMCGGDLDKV